MTKTRPFGRDRGLQARMVATMLLLGLVYAGFGAALFAAGAGAVVMALALGGLALAQLLLADKLALRAMGARVVSPAEAPGLHALVERLCVQADLPKPRVALADSPVPNAFALGRSPRHAVVCASTGLLELLEPNELEGVMAHELAHVQHRDVAVMTFASFFASVASMIAQMGLFFGGGGRDRDSGALPLMAVVAISFAVYALSSLLMLALSRYREYAADRGAALLTGRPTALAAALARISGTMRMIPQRDLRAAQQLNAFFIVPARAGAGAATRPDHGAPAPRAGLRGLFSTHPPVERRIARLERMEEALQRAR